MMNKIEKVYETSVSKAGSQIQILQCQILATHTDILCFQVKQWFILQSSRRYLNHLYKVTVLMLCILFPSMLDRDREAKGLKETRSS